MSKAQDSINASKKTMREKRAAMEATRNYGKGETSGSIYHRTGLKKSSKESSYSQ